MRFTLPITLPGLNDYTSACRGNAYGANAMKKRAEAAITAHLPAAEPRDDYPLGVAIRWVEPSRRRDPDNVAFATKFILDAMVRAGVIDGDTHRHIASIAHTFAVDKTSPRIEVTVTAHREEPS